MLLLRAMCALIVSLMTVGTLAQTVQPVIVDYKVKGEGKFSLTNNTLLPMAVVLEPKSFSITPDGNGVYRPLDPDIHLQLSTMSFRLEPKQTYFVFYKVTADKLPAWFTVYSIFSSVQHTSGLDVRILLPHTVYLYPKLPMAKDAVRVKSAMYVAQSGKIIVDIENTSADLGRVQEVRVTSGHEVAVAAGFPILPGGLRHVEVRWDEKKEPPQMLLLRFEHFTLTQPLSISEEQ